MRYRISHDSSWLKARLSPDGGHVFYETTDIAVADRESNSHRHIVDFDVAAGTTRLVTHLHGQPTVPLSGTSTLYDIDAAGRNVLFFTGATVGVLASDVAWFDAAGALYLQDMQGSARTLLSHRENNVALPYKAFASSDWFSSMGAWLSRDGRRVLLDSGPRTMAAARYNDSGRAAMMYDLAARRWEFVGLTPGGAFPDQPLSFKGWSDDGSVVLFTSKAGNLAQEATGFDPVLYRYLRRSGRMSLVSRHAAAENLAAGLSVYERTIELSADGRVAVFASGGQSFLQVDVNGAPDLYRATYSKIAGEVFCDGMEGF